MTASEVSSHPRTFKVAGNYDAAAVVFEKSYETEIVHVFEGGIRLLKYVTFTPP